MLPVAWLLTPWHITNAARDEGRELLILLHLNLLLVLSSLIGVVSPRQLLHSWVEVGVILCICSICTPEPIGFGWLIPHSYPARASTGTLVAIQ